MSDSSDQDYDEPEDDDYVVDKPKSPKKSPAKPKTPKEPKEKTPKEPKETKSPKKSVTPKTALKKEKIMDVNDSMADEDRNVFTSLDSKTPTKGKKASIEDIYQKKSQLEHILLRPDTYIGSVEHTDKSPMWVYDPVTEKLVREDISYAPGLYKIFDEILVNAADNKQRDPKMNTIRIEINQEKNMISVFNNGKGIPVVLHKVEKVYVPELIFGTLLTSSNYDDSEKKTTGGRNGYGAKLCNIFSTEFTLETSSKEYGKAFKQTWINNMTKGDDAKIVKSSGEDFTRVTFKPDLAKFGMEKLDKDICGLMMRRAFDIAGTTPGVKVYLNGSLIPVHNFKTYVELYTKANLEEAGEDRPIIYEKVNDRWEVAFTLSDGEGFRQVSFVNSIATTKGGLHVENIVNNIMNKIKPLLTKKAGMPVQPAMIKNNMWLFVNCLIENPTFDSQTKENMTLQPRSFGSRCDLSEKFLKKVQSSGLIETVVAKQQAKQLDALNRKGGKKTNKIKGIPKLEDANDAGTSSSHLCTLILTEGDSAKTLAVSGLAVVGRDRYGVFPLRGKLLNVREGNIKQVAENQEINALIKILGLAYKKDYSTEENFKSLRYGSIMIMADQDQDGSHIKGLVINFIHHNWPALIKRNFVEQFITPIVKASRNKEELSFFSIPEYQEWRNNEPNSEKYKIKYYKGLGTSTSKEAKEYFSDMVRHRIKFKYSGPEDDAALDMAFSKKKVEERKDWLSKWMSRKKSRREEGLADEYLYNKDIRTVSYKDFINKELVLFSNTDNERSIPSLVDGLKPGQRKVVFSCFQRADKREVKVAQLAGSVGELSAYHHGEGSLMGTIVNLAQDFVGSNNINLLLPIGQFGTRLQGGKDSASPRYIFTKLNPVTRHLFPESDDNVLRFLSEDNQRIEPEWYCPIIPTVLVNGASGIGTAWSTNIPNYNPRQIVENIRRLIRGDEQKPMIPWYKGFRGDTLKMDSNRFVSNGEVAILGENTVEITELPIKTWTQSYKESVLEPMQDKEGSKYIKDFREYHTDTTVRFVVKFEPGKLQEAEKEGLHKFFKLQTVINTSSMVLFDANGCLRKYNTPEEICKEFFETRKQKYIERKAFLEGHLKAQSDRLSNQARFIMAKIKGDLVIENKKKLTIVEQLKKLKLEPDPIKKWKQLMKKRQAELYGDSDEFDNAEDESVDVDDADAKLADYEYLVGMSIIRLCEEEKNKLIKESDAKLAQLKDIQKKSWSDLWEEDLQIFLEQLKKQEDIEKADRESAMKKKVEVKGRTSAAAHKIGDILPSIDGERIVPAIDKAMKDKYEKLTAPKKEKTPKEPKEPKEPKRPKKNPNELKTPTEKKTKKSKKDEWNSDQSSDEEVENGVEHDIFASDNDDETEEILPQKSTRADRASRKRQDEENVDTEKADGPIETPKTTIPKGRKRTAKEESDGCDSDVIEIDVDTPTKRKTNGNVAAVKKSPSPGPSTSKKTPTVNDYTYTPPPGYKLKDPSKPHFSVYSKLGLPAPPVKPLDDPDVDSSDQETWVPYTYHVPIDHVDTPKKAKDPDRKRKFLAEKEKFTEIDKEKQEKRGKNRKPTPEEEKFDLAAYEKVLVADMARAEMQDKKAEHDELLRKYLASDEAKKEGESSSSLKAINELDQEKSTPRTKRTRRTVNKKNFFDSDSD